VYYSKEGILVLRESSPWQRKCREVQLFKIIEKAQWKWKTK
jgi:hypothetical protein